MEQVTLRSVDKYYGDFHALKDIDLSIDNGAFVALVGPSGCGKSTLLRTIAGLETISSGEIRIAGERVNEIPPRRRNVAMVFQSYALYPHMTVERNMTYSLRLRRTSKPEIDALLKSAATTLGLDELLARYPRELSGGQRQRVAMGRAIVRQPEVFLFDEPLSNLDAELRTRMRGEVRALHERLQATSVYVTHDQIEAMTMADHVVVLRFGRIEQQGPPLDLYDHPANKFVAGFIGSPAMNFLPATIGRNGDEVVVDGQLASLPLSRRFAPGRTVEVGLRPEHLQPRERGPLVADVTVIEATGNQAYILADARGQQLAFLEQGRTALRRNDTVALGIDPGLVHLFDPDTGDTLRPLSS
ncbi:ABC transporter ATP-binding protein [Bauldia sp.]|uniref:ABC transporter ATP-binding protein n=1 Tax=Bauldia sp. TaxID=2575872 RepID=UPI003BAAEE60